MSAARAPQRLDFIAAFHRDPTPGTHHPARVHPILKNAPQLPSTSSATFHYSPPRELILCFMMCARCEWAMDEYQLDPAPKAWNRRRRSSSFDPLPERGTRDAACVVRAVAGELF
jgi:hypothetical protein